MSSILLVVVTMVVILSCFYVLHLLYNRYVDEGIHPYTGGKRYTLFYEFVRNLLFLFAVIFVLFKAYWWITLIFFFMYLTHLSMTIQKYRAVQKEEVLDTWTYNEESKEKARQAFESNSLPKLAVKISTDKIVFTNRYVYVHNKTKLKIKQNTFDNLVFEDARVEGDFLILRYIVTVFPVRTYYLYIPKDKRKTVKRLVATIETEKKVK